jgi:hypothetical protein
MLTPALRFSITRFFVSSSTDTLDILFMLPRVYKQKSCYPTKQQITLDTLVNLTKFRKILVLNFRLFSAHVDIKNLS